MADRHEIKHTDTIDTSRMSAKKKAEMEAKRKEDEEKFAALMKKQTAKKGRQTIKTAPRDPNIIRGVSGTDQIECITVRKIGLDNNETSDVGEKVMIPREWARHLQENGAIRVQI